MTEKGEFPNSHATIEKKEELPSCVPEALRIRGGAPLGFALLRVNRSMIFENQPLPELSALPIAQLRLLWTVRHLEDATMKDFSERLQVSQSTVTQLADQLVRRKFIERNADLHDRRVVRLKLSEFGKSILTQDEKKHQEMFEEVWGKLSNDERMQVMTGLSLLGDAAERVLTEKGRPPKHNLAPPVPLEGERAGDDPSAQPVLDLMTRRVRGQS